MKIEAIDHLAITVTDLDATVDFYRSVLGAEVVTFGPGRTAVKLGRNKLNLHHVGTDATPVAARPTPGSVDICFLTETPLTEVAAHLERCGVAIEMGPIERTGTEGQILSVYVRDPDGNLVEIANRIAG